jgi:hypothetical protein
MRKHVTADRPRAEHADDRATLSRQPNVEENASRHPVGDPLRFIWSANMFIRDADPAHTRRLVFPML